MRPSFFLVVCGVLVAAAGGVCADEAQPEGDPPRDPFVLDWWSMDGGGGPSTGGDFDLLGTIGQPDVGNAIGGNFVLMGGFLAGGGDFFIFADNFESSNTSAWSSTVGSSKHGGGE